MPDPLMAVGLLLRKDNAFLGTCFAFRQPTHFLTAAHCIRKLSPVDLTVFLPDADRSPRSVGTILRHPTADFAIVVLADTEPLPITPFQNFVSNLRWGEDFAAFGFPEDAFGPTPGEPTARLFRGHVQRFMDYSSHRGYSYRAAELNIGAPAGLSGGPVFRPGAPVMVTALVTENLQSSTFLQSVVEVQEGGNTYKEQIHQMINYGVALVLSAHADFVDAHVPQRD